MDIDFIVNGIQFVADDAKMKRNPKKHDGITFEQAAEAFFDPFLKWMDASRNNEDRYAIIGYDNSQKLLFVVFVELFDEKIRIISARKATKEERKFYEND